MSTQVVINSLLETSLPQHESNSNQRFDMDIPINILSVLNRENPRFFANHHKNDSVRSVLDSSKRAILSFYLLSCQVRKLAKNVIRVSNDRFHFMLRNTFKIFLNIFMPPNSVSFYRFLFHSRMSFVDREFSFLNDLSLALPISISSKSSTNCEAEMMISITKSARGCFRSLATSAKLLYASIFRQVSVVLGSVVGMLKCSSGVALCQ